VPKSSDLYVGTHRRQGAAGDGERQNETGSFGLSPLLLANAAAAQEVTLKAATAFTENTTYSRPFERFISRVNEDGKGILRINYVGGPKALRHSRSEMP